MKTASTTAANQTPATPGGMPHPKQSTSERRKAQNRAAQRTYRLKRIARLKELEDLAASAGLLDDPKSRQTKRSEKGEQESTPNGSDAIIAATPSDSGIIGLNDTTELGALMPFNPNFGYDLDTSWALLDTSSALTADFQPYTATAARGPQSIVPLMVPWEASTPQTQSSTRSLSPSSKSTEPATVTSVETYYADPYANNLRLHAMTFMLACQINSQAIGMADILAHCDDDLMSPFFNPEAPGKPQILDSALIQYKNIKRDLRPNIVQITTPHHPSVDIMPFPEIRSRFIELTACDPPLIDEDEFWDDCTVNDGLVCWGSMAPWKGVAPAGGGAPWDSRSWEAKRWFISKWSFVVGGDDSELGRNSEWWRSMRGVGQGFSF